MTTRNTSTTVTTVSIEQFAFNVGSLAAQLKESSLPFHVAYKGGTTEQKRDLRVRWSCAHIQGALQARENVRAAAEGTTARTVTLAAATAIREAGKGGTVRAAHKALIDCAYSDFRYNVVRPVKTAAITRGNAIIPAEVLAHLQAIDALTATYKDMRAMCDEYITEASK